MARQQVPRHAFWFYPPSRLTAASEDELRSHLGELLEEGVVVLEALLKPDEVRLRSKSLEWCALEHLHRLVLADLLDELLEAVLAKLL